MNRLTRFVCSLTLGALMCAVATSVSAHDPEENNLYLVRSLDETAHLAFFAACNSSRDGEDASLVPSQELISFEVKVVGSTPGGSENEQIGYIEVLPWSWGELYVPAELGRFLQVSIRSFTGPGCGNSIKMGWRLVGPGDETRAASFGNEMWATIVGP